MSRPQLNIKFDGDGEKEFLETVKARAEDERVSLKDFVIDALKMRLAKSKESSQSTQPTPSLSKGELQEFSRRLANVELSLRSEIRKDREQIALLASAIAQIEHRLDSTLPLSPPVDEHQAREDRQARQSTWREWEEHCEPGTGAWGTWGSDAVEFLDAVRWNDADG
jgi:hypothetical protein